jgi:hypothetical protein
MADEVQREEERAESAAEVREETEAAAPAPEAEPTDEPAAVTEEATEAPEAEESVDACETPTVVPATGDRFTVAQSRVAAARERVLSAEEEIEECIRNIQEDLAEFEAYEKEALLPVIGESQRLLESIGMEEAAIEPALAELELEDPEEEKLRIEDLSSGKGGAFFWGLLAAVATVGGWYAYAVQKAGVSLIPKELPDLASLSTLAGKVSLLLGPAENPSVGAAVVVGSALVVWWLVYAVLVAVRAAKNQRLAEEIEEQAGFYCRKKEECKAMMGKVREHLASLGQTARKYEVLLAEKNAGLRRALFIEEAESFDKLHERSQATAREIEMMLAELDRLLATPMARSGMLTEESVEALHHARRVISDQILRLYN